MSDVARLSELVRTERYTEAVSVYNELVAKGRANGKAHLWGAYAARCAGNLELSQSATEAAEASDGMDTHFVHEAWHNLGGAYTYWHRYAEAAAAYRRAIALYQPRAPEILPTVIDLGWVQCLMGDRAAARQALDYAGSMKPPRSLTWHHLVGKAFLLSTGGEGERKVAMGMLQHIDGAGDSVSLSVRAHAQWLRGRMAMVEELWAAAQHYADQAAELARRSDQRCCIRDAEELLQAIAERRRAG